MNVNEMMSRTRPPLPLAVVIGAGCMGMAIARRLGQQNRLLLVDLNADRLSEVANTLREEGNEVETVQCDITDRASVSAAAKRAEALGPLRVLAHVAGVSPGLCSDWRKLVAINLVGPYLTAEAFLPLAQTGTAAIYIASLAAHLGAPLAEAMLRILDEPLQPDFFDRLEAEFGKTPSLNDGYIFSKTALVRLCQRRAGDWGKRQARMLSVSPGFIATTMGINEFKNNPIKREILPRTALQRQGSVLEIADVVEYLASDRASFITGTDLLVDGGLNAGVHYPG